MQYSELTSLLSDEEEEEERLPVAQPQDSNEGVDKSPQEAQRTDTEQSNGMNGVGELM